MLPIGHGPGTPALGIQHQSVGISGEWGASRVNISYLGTVSLPLHLRGPGPGCEFQERHVSVDRGSGCGKAEWDAKK